MCYEKIGKALSSTDEVKKIIETIKESTRAVTTSGVTDPFVVIVGSSGVGKTQAAFSLSPALKVVYLLLTPIREGDQNIYQSFKQLASHFNSAIRLDIDDLQLPLEQQCVQTDTLELHAHPLRSAGLLLAVCRHLRAQAGRDGPVSPGSLARRSTSLTYKPATILEFREEIKGVSRLGHRLRRGTRQRSRQHGCNHSHNFCT